MVVTRNFGSLLVLSAAAFAFSTALAQSPKLKWKALPPLPDAEGFAGMYAGAMGETLVAAGGTQFENGIPWWRGGRKIWSNAIYVLEPVAERWRTAAERLPRPLGDGVSVTHRDRIICVGGGDETRAHADVFALYVRSGRVERSAHPPLPVATLKMGGAAIGDLVYVIGGRDGPNSVSALRALWGIDLSRPRSEQRWIRHPDCPGPGRMMPIVAVRNESLYVFGGIEIRPDEAGRPKNVAPYLRDAWHYVPGAGGSPGKWKQLADVPQPLAGAPSPAWLADADTLLILGGVDGAIETIADRGSIRALPGQMLAYHISANRWTHAGEMPAQEVRVNAPTVPWRSGCAIISGEFLPARRTPACTLVTIASGR